MRNHSGKRGRGLSSGGLIAGIFLFELLPERGELFRAEVSKDFSIHIDHWRELLAGAGADVNAHAANGLTPLHFAAWNGHGAVVRLLLALGADPTAKDSTGRTPYELAAGSQKTSANDKADVLAALTPR